MSKGLVHVYCGEGKGKTTASIGLAVRAAGAGKNVLVVQFLKGRPSGEVSIIDSLPNACVMRADAPKKFTWEMTDSEKAELKTQHDELLHKARTIAEKGDCDTLILDEALGACGCGLLDEQALLAFIHEKPEELEVVLTGRNPSQAIIDTADYVTEMRKIKHPFDQGIAARRGSEY